MDVQLVSDAAAPHTLSPADVMARLATGPTGLSEAEAAARLQRVGPNRVPSAKPASAFRVLLDQITSLVVWLLAAAAAVSLAIGDYREAGAIGAVLLLNTGLGFVMDLRARRAMEALLQLDLSRSTVVRDGRPRLVDAQELAPGDLIEVERGQRVPADARLVSAADLRTDEASLTGESLPVSKQPHARLDAATPLAERVTMIYKGTTIAAGAARAIVTATGRTSELGRIGELVASIEEERTPLEKRLDELGRRLVWVVLAAALVVAGLELANGAPVALVLETALALAVAAVPEGLPVVATIALAIGLRRMAARRALVRRLAAVEALGSTTIVCSDKTRTLTSGDMTLIRLWTPDGVLDLASQAASGSAASNAAPADALTPTFRGALEAAVLASRSRPASADGGADAAALADPVDAALLRGAGHAGLDTAAIFAARPAAVLIPFASERRWMAAFARVDGGFHASVKGAPGRILELCARVRLGGEDLPLDAARRDALTRTNRELAAAGLRVLGLAAGPVAGADEAGLRDLTFLGFAGLADPPAPGVKDTIARLRDAGLRTIMLTGDQRVTAEAIGRELGLVTSSDEVLEGRDLQGLSADGLRDRLGRVAAIGRVSPEDKLTVVRALQARGEIVAMLGDGVNDAAALRQADVGVAMGVRGTDVARDAASIVLQNDRFETIGAAVEEGRIVYDNIRKFVFYLFSCNLAEVLVLLGIGLAGLPPLLLPLQILWLNMVTDTFPALALAVEPGDRDVMQRPPRNPHDAMLSRPFLGWLTFYAVLITIATLAASVWALAHAPETASTVCFMTLALAQILHLGNARSAEPVLRPARILGNRYALAAVVGTVGLQLVAIHTPAIAQALHVAPLGLREWTAVVIAAAVPALIGQGLKLARLRGRPA